MEFKVPKITFWRVALLIIWTLGLYSVIVRFTQGLGAATNLSDSFPWGIWIGFDILVGVGLAAGGFVITATVHVFNLKDFKPIVRPTVITAFLGYLLVVSALLLDLGLPHHVWHPIIYWNHHSVMFEVGWCVMLYTSVLFMEFLPIVLEKFGYTKPLKLMHKIMVLFVIAGVLLSTLHQSSLGTLYVITPDKLHPLWYTGMLPLLFFLSAIGGGLAMVIFESYTSSRAFGKELEFSVLERIGKALVVVLFFSFIVRLQTLVANNVLGHIFSGSYESVFFNIEILLGTILPIALLVQAKLRQNRAWLFFSSILVLVGFIMNRLNVSITGMERSSGVSYFPSWMEVAITMSIVSAGFVLFRLAAKNLPLFGHQAHFNTSQPPLVAERKDGGRVIVALCSIVVLFVLGMAFGFTNIDIHHTRDQENTETVLSEWYEGELIFPGPIDFQKSEDSPGLVTFNHESHVDSDLPNCLNCHQEMFKIRPKQAGAFGSVNMEKLYENKQCGTCHNGEDTFGIDEGCEYCHQE
jgi:c(7)-type cytochrome triheme protein